MVLLDYHVKYTDTVEYTLNYNNIHTWHICQRVNIRMSDVYVRLVFTYCIHDTNNVQTALKSTDYRRPISR